MKKVIAILTLALSFAAFSNDQLNENAESADRVSCSVSFNSSRYIYTYVGYGRTIQDAKSDAVEQCYAAQKATCNYVVGFECSEID